MTDTSYPPVIVVDENDNEIGTAMLSEVLEKGWYHRVVAVFVFDDNGRVLLQHRGPNVKVYPNRWDQAAGGQVDAGRTYEEVATGELAEELGLHDVPTETMGTHRSSYKENGRVNNEFERVFEAVVPQGMELKPELTELTDLKWFTPEELNAEVAMHPESFTSGLLYDLREYFPSFGLQLSTMALQ